jgi:uncharacterized CHY-type Zn-finger protein
MVKFGRYLNDCSNGNQFARDAYMDYKALKKFLKQVESPSDTMCAPCCDGKDAAQNTFLSRIKEEVNKLNRFVAQTQGKMKTCEELRDLAIFAETNRVAFVKIVKKLEKKCGPCCELQFFLQGLPKEPFLDSLADEMPNAQAELQTRLVLAGVCRESVVQETLQPEEVHIIVPEASQIQPPEANSSLAQQQQNMTSQRQARLRRFRAPVAFISYAVFPISLACALKSFGVIPDAAMSVFLGLHLFSLAMFGLWYLASSCRAVGLQLEQAPRVRDCVWQQLRYSELCSKEFTPSFAVVRVTRGDDDRGIVKVLEKQYPDLHPFSVAVTNVAQSTCGCCLEEFTSDDAVVLLPCYHVFCDECITSWASSSAKGAHNCPTCRSSFADIHHRV